MSSVRRANGEDRARRPLTRKRFYRDYPEIIIVSHDASLTGAPLLLLTLLEAWQRLGGPRFRIVLRSGGPLEARFRALGRVWNMNLPAERSWPTRIDRAALLSFCGPDVKLIYGNTGAVGEALEALDPLGCPVLAHVHELERMLAIGIGPERFRLVLNRAARFVAASSAVAENLMRTHGVPAEKMDQVCGFLADDYGAEYRGTSAREPVVLGVGTTDWRKGPDLFVEVAAHLAAGGNCADARFVWVGAPTEAGQVEALRRKAEHLGVAKVVEFVGPRPDVRPFYERAAVYACCSREEPFGLVALEAAAYAVPTVYFAEAGGMGDFVCEDSGQTVPMGDVAAMARAVGSYLTDPRARETAGGRARERLARDHRASVAVRRILTIVEQTAALPAKP